MDDDTWCFAFTASSRSYLKSPSVCIDFEEIEEDDELKTEYPCPYCSEDFDLLGLCCHIDDEHHLEAGYGVCPVCALRVGMNMVDHITTQHGNIFKISFYFIRSEMSSCDSYSTLSSLRKEMHEAQYQSFLSRSRSSLSSTNTAPDPLLSFISCPSLANSSESVKSATSSEVTLEDNGSDENMLEKDVQSDKEHSEKSKRCEFVQGLLLFTFIDDGL
ncbi:drought-induced protein19 [Hibiscus trionum]|uniref:Drought-induced protein19 n=1 Tax=Hibiscus trionum TaxID=183268 RepID=A0A9W7LSI6_HIBTR|nr:drought-induced protein19 [Hibiscus trionum]